MDIEATDGTVTVKARGTNAGWDSFAMPADVWRSYRNTGDGDLVVMVITAGDHRKKLVWDEKVIAGAGAINRAIDANGYVAPKNFVDRSQR